MGNQKIDELIKDDFPKTSLAKLTASAGTLIVGIKSEIGQRKKFEKNGSFSISFNFWTSQTSNLR